MKNHTLILLFLIFILSFSPQQASFLESSSSFTLQNLKSSINSSSQYWSTGRINLDVINTSGQALCSYFEVQLSDVKINNKPFDLTKVDNVEQRGIGYQEITFVLISPGNVLLKIKCSGSWASFNSSSTLSLSILFGVGYEIKSISPGTASIVNENSPSPTPTPTPSPQPTPTPEPTPTSNYILSGYNQSWSNSWGNFVYSKYPKYIKMIFISFADPKCSYTLGSNTFTGTGLNLHSDLFLKYKESILEGKAKNPHQKFILSVGGATYPFGENYNPTCAWNIVKDLGLDGVDLDFEEQPTCQNINTSNVTCSTDVRLNKIILDFFNKKNELGLSNKLLTAATWSVGAYGNDEFPNVLPEYGPGSGYAGMWINPLKQSGHMLDDILIMSYDASNEYKPVNAAKAYKKLVEGKKTRIHLGIELPNEAWGGHVITTEEVKYLYSQTKNIVNGMFIWSFEKQNQVKSPEDASFYMKNICKYANGEESSLCIGDIPK